MVLVVFGSLGVMAAVVVPFCVCSAFLVLFVVVLAAWGCGADYVSCSRLLLWSLLCLAFVLLVLVVHLADRALPGATF